MEKISLIIEIVVHFFIFAIFAVILYNFKGLTYKDHHFFNIICFINIISFLVFVICQSVFLGMIISYNLSYNCSEDITNELLRKENEKTKINIIYIAINLGLDFINIFINSIYILINDSLFECCNNWEKYNEEKKRIKSKRERKRNAENVREIVVNRRIINGAQEPVRESDANRGNNNRNEQQSDQIRAIRFSGNISLYTTDIASSN